MNRFVPAAALAAALAVPLLAGGAARAASPAHHSTDFTLLTGSPEAGGAGADGVLLVPGTVLPLGSDTADAVRSSLALASATTDLADKLRRTLRLERLEVEYRTSRVLTVDEGWDLPAIAPGSSVIPSVTLLGFNDELATYRVTFRDGERTLADTSVSIPFGRRSVVGGLNGDEAPYVFLVVEPPPRDSPPGGDDRITPPRIVEKSFPSYPGDAKKERIEGVVVVQTVIAKDGSIARTRVLKGAHPSLDAAAVAAIRGWRFEPALLDGEPVAVHYNLTINFRLDQERDS
jgi:TonB family protein